MALTPIIELPEKTISIYCEGTNIYAGCDDGKIHKIVITGLAHTIKKVLSENPTAMTSDATYLYVGTDKGRVLKITIADGTLATLEGSGNSSIISIWLNSTTLYMGLADGRIVSRATT